MPQEIAAQRVCSVLREDVLAVAEQPVREEESGCRIRGLGDDGDAVGRVMTGSTIGSYASGAPLVDGVLDVMALLRCRNIHLSGR